MSKTWYRLCVDVDDQGHPVGTSAEKHVGERIESLTTGPVPGPFDDPAYALHQLFVEVRHLWGFAVALPFSDRP
jgi:hypothetical protein